MDEPTGSEFAAILTPYRSLGPRGFLVLMGLIGLVSFIAGLAFYSIGAWPVMGFFGLDALLVYGAFKLNYRDARKFEVVDLKGDCLTVRRVSPSGREQSWEFHPYWARVEAAELAHGRRELRLVSHGRELVFGRFLSDDEKLDFAEALNSALLDYRGGARV
ncbi:MAG: DUF2244 domain-containing protein [Hyphomicrobiaceae bacterium]